MSKELIEAARIGDLKKVDELLQDPDINAAYEDNRPLREAAANGHFNVVERLLEEKTVAENAHVNNNEVLHTLVRLRQISLISWLLRIKAVQENAHTNHNAVLRTAIQNGHLDVIKRLLEEETIRNSAAIDGTLEYTIESGSVPIVGQLLQIQVIRNNAARYGTGQTGNGALKQAIRRQSLPIIEQLLAIEAVRNSAAIDGSLSLAMESGNITIVERLLQIETIRNNAYSTLHNIIVSGNAIMVQRLLQIEAVRNKVAAGDSLKTALYYGDKQKSLQIVEQLLQLEAVRHKAATDGTLSYACSLGNTAIIQRLLQIEELRSNVSTDKALQDAIDYGRVEPIRLLLQIEAVRSKADKILVDIATRVLQEREKEEERAKDPFYKKDPIPYMESQRLEMIEALLQIQAVRDNIIKNAHTLSPQLASLLNPQAIKLRDLHSSLVEAVKKGDLEAVKKLLSDQKVAKMSGDNGNQALCLAAAGGHLEIMEELLKIPEVESNAAAASEALAAGGSLLALNRLLEVKGVKEKIAIKANYNQELRQAAGNGHLPLVEALLEIPEIEANAAAALEAVAKGGSLPVLNRLLKVKGVKEKAAANNNQALCQAAGNGHLPLVEELLKIPEVEANAAVALEAVIKGGSLPVLQRLLKVKGVKDKAAANNSQVLHQTVINGHLPLVEELLKIPEIEKCAATDKSFLITAIQNGHVAAAKRLLKVPQAIYYNVIYDKNNDVLYRAVEYGRSEIVEEILKAPEINAAANKNELLILAIRKGYLDIVKCLLKRKEVRDSITVGRKEDHEALKTAVQCKDSSGADRLPIIYVLYNAYQELGIKLPSYLSSDVWREEDLSKLITDCEKVYKTRGSLAATEAPALVVSAVSMAPKELPAATPSTVKQSTNAATGPVVPIKEVGSSLSSSTLKTWIYSMSDGSRQTFSQEQTLGAVPKSSALEQSSASTPVKQVPKPEEDTKVMMDKQQSSEKNETPKPLLPLKDKMGEKPELSKKPIPSETLKKAITKQEWSSIAEMTWISKDDSRQTSEMSLKEAEEFRILLKKTGIDTSCLSIGGDYAASKYYVILNIKEKEFIELMNLAKERSQKHSPKAS